MKRPLSPGPVAALSPLFSVLAMARLAAGCSSDPAPVVVVANDAGDAGVANVPDAGGATRDASEAPETGPGPGIPDAAPDVPAAPVPTVKIVSPTNGEAVTLTAEGKAQVTFTVTNYALKLSGQCDDVPTCGHAHFYIDGDDCNDEELSVPYNRTVESVDPATIDLALCKKGKTGVKRVRLELRADNHRPLSPVVYDEVQVTFK